MYSFAEKKRKETLLREYFEIVFLNNIKCDISEKTLCEKIYFDKDIKLNNRKSMLNSMIKKGFAERDKSFFIASTSKGRKLLSDDIIKLTEKGKSFLDSKNDLIEFYEFATPYVNITEYLKTKRKIKEEPKFEYAMISILMNKLKWYKKMEDYIGVRDIFFNVGELYERVPYDFRAIYSYITSLYFDVSGLGYYSTFLRYIKGEITLRHLNCEYEGLYINPETVRRIKKVKRGYRDDMVDHIYERNPISINLCSKKAFLQLVNDIICGEYSYIKWQKYFSETFVAMIGIADKYRRRRIGNG